MEDELPCLWCQYPFYFYVVTAFHLQKVGPGQLTKTIFDDVLEQEVTNSGLCCYLAYVHNIFLLTLAGIFCYAPSSRLHDARVLYGEDKVAAPLIILPIAILCGIWMWSLHFFRTRAWVLVMNAITCNVMYHLFYIYIYILYFFYSVYYHSSSHSFQKQ